MLILVLIDVQYLLKLCLALKKVRIFKITPPQVPSTSKQNSPQRNFRFSLPLEREGGLFPYSLTLFGKPLVSRHLPVKSCSYGWFRDPKVHHRAFDFSKNTEKGTSNAFLKAANLCLRKK